jgi:aryl-alcohol dehydrogenase-like predicted oxidoreductase
MALGTWGLSGDGYGPLDESEARKVIERALEIGVTTFDTADAYGAGKMEKLLGEVLPKDVPVTVVTKVGTDRTTEPPRKRFDADYIEAAARRSLQRLGRERIDVLLLHNPSADCLALTDATDTMKSLKKQGVCAAWGVSVGESDAGRAALQKGAEVIEIAYNLFHGTELHRLAGELMIARAGVLARSTLGYGLLAATWKKDHEFAEGDHRRERWTKLELERRVEQLDAVKFLLRGDVRTLRAAAIRFVLANNLVSSAVLGPKSIAQLEELVREVGAGPVYMHDDDLSQLPRALERVGIGS